MKTYNYLIYKDRIKPLAPQKGVSGNVGYYECTFEFDKDWDSSLSAVAVFVGEIAYTAKIIDGKCIVPHEVLKENGEIYIGVYATNGKDNLLRISTNLIPFEVEEGAFREGNLPIAPSPDVWETYIAAMNQTLIETTDARDKANEYSAAAKQEAENAKTEVNNAKAEVENAKAEVKKAEQEKIGAEEYKIQATESAELSASHKDEAWRAAQMADGAAGSASSYALASQRFRNEAEGFKNQAQSSVTGAWMNAEKAEEAAGNASKSEFESRRYAEQAMGAKENAEASVDRILQEGESFVRNYGEQYINGQKTFVEKTILTAIGSYNAKLPISASEIEIEAYDGMGFESTNGYPIVFQVGNKTYTLYDNGEFSADKISTKEITSGDEEGEVKLDGKPIATEEYVDEAIKDVEGGNITIDDVPTEGSTNAVSSGGVKSYVDSSIQQAILDSWAEVIEP